MKHYAVIYTIEERSRVKRFLRRLLRREPRGEIVWAGPVNGAEAATVELRWDESGRFTIE